MTTQTDQRTDLEILTDLGLDYAFDPPCEHSGHGKNPWHGGPAWALIQLLEKPCGCPKAVDLLYLCRGSWDYAAVTGVYCPACEENFTREQVWRFVALVRP